MAQLAIPAAKEASRYLPTLWSKAKQMFPGAIEKASALIGDGKSTPQAIVNAAARSGNSMVTTNILNKLAQSGVPPEFMKSTVPVLGAADLELLQSQYAELVLAQRAAVNAAVPAINHPAAHARTLNNIAALNRRLNFRDSTELVEFVEAIHLLDAEAIAAAYAVNVAPTKDPEAVARALRVPRLATQ